MADETGLTLQLTELVNAIRCLSDQTEMGRLAETLLIIALEYTGSERGLLLADHSQEEEIEAEAIRHQGVVKVALASASAILPKYPKSILRYVHRTQQRVFLNDTRVAHQFSQDTFFCDNIVRSAMCFPLAAQHENVGLLYLENSSSPRAFDRDRLAILELLSINAALVLGNVRAARGAA